MKILVTDGDNRAALAITRSLGRKGHTIVVGECRHPSLASSSKYCSERLHYPHPARHPEDFLQSLLHSIKDKNIDVLLPVSDITTIPVCQHKSEFEKYCRVPFADRQSIDLAADKAELFRIATTAGLPIPKTVWLEKGDQIDKIVRTCSFPIVIKPGKSRIKTHNGWVSTSVKYADNSAELSNLLSLEPESSYPILLQERIPGPGIGVFVCYNKGVPIAFFSHRRIREKPPSGGVSVLRESIAVPPLAKQYSEQLLNKINWHGVAMVEFKHDIRDDTPKLMEINGRFWGSLQLAIDAGVDFPDLLIQTLENENVPILKDYRVGIRTRWFLGDIDSLFLVLFKDRTQLKLPSGHPGKLATLFQFLKLWQKKTNYEIAKVDDIKPWFYEIGKWLSPKNR